MKAGAADIVKPGAVRMDIGHDAAMKVGADYKLVLELANHSC